MPRFRLRRVPLERSPLRPLLALLVPAVPFVVAAAVGNAQPTAGEVKCGVERWPVKTLTDGADASQT